MTLNEYNNMQSKKISNDQKLIQSDPKLQHNMWMQTPFRSNIGIHKWYLGETGGVGYFFMLVFSFYIWFDCFSGPRKYRIEVER